VGHLAAPLAGPNVEIGPDVGSDLALITRNTVFTCGEAGAYIVTRSWRHPREDR
jgi:hypothetical protein